MYDKNTDLLSIQADVLTQDTKSNTQIKARNKLKTNDGKVLGAINEVVTMLADIKNQSEAATEKAESVKEEVRVTVTEMVTQKMTEIVSGGIQNDEIKCNDNQTIFTLSKKPVDKDNIIMYVNGLKYPKADYVYDQDSNTVTWLNTEKDEKHSNPFSIKAVDVVSFVYMA